MPRVGPLLSPLLIGRDELLDLAERRLAEAATGRRQFLLLAGEAGIGKSRLMAAIETKAHAAGFHTAAGLLAPQDRDVPGASLLDMARSMTRMESWSELGRRLLALTDETIAAPRPTRRLLVLRAVDLVVDAIDVPTVLGFDDLQWADDLSLEIVTELARATRDRRLLIVGAYRTDELAPGALLREWRARLLTQRTAEEARLAPLTREQTALMTTLILGTGLPAPRDVVDAVHERTDGVPLHIEELLGAIGADDRTDSRAIRDAAVPDTLEDAILRRISRLSPGAQAVARSGAVIGRCFVPDVLAGVMGVPTESLDAPLRELVDQHVLEPRGTRGLYDFHHVLLRDVLYRTLPESGRRRLHARAAEYGRELEGASEIHASLHFERAGLPTQAFRSALQGAQVAARLSSHREALGLFGRAIANLPPDLAPGERAAIHLGFAIEAAANEQIEACERAAAAARTLYQEAGDTVGAAGQVELLAWMARRQVRPIDERLALIRTGLGELGISPDGADAQRVRALLLIELACVALEAIDAPSARAALDDARSAACAAGDDASVLQVESLVAMLDALGGDVPGGVDRVVAAALEARARGFEDTGVTAYRDAAILAARVMDYRRAAAALAEGLRYADGIQQSHCAHLMGATNALVAWADGRWDDAATLGEHALADHGSARGAAMAQWPLGYTLLGRGELERAREELAAAEAIGEAGGSPDIVLAASWGLAEAALLAGDAEEAVARSTDALAIAARTGEHGRFAPFVVTGTRARLATDRPADAQRWLAGASEVLGGADAPFAAALHHAAGLLALARGSTSSARESLERAVAGWDACPRRWEATWARADLAACLLRTGRFVEGAGLIAEVRAVADALGSPALAGRAEELGRLARRHDAEAPPWHPLTAREFEVARLIAGGLTNAEIAAQLSVAPRTVGAHVEHVLAKLGAGRRTEIASWVTTTVRAAAHPDGNPATHTATGARVAATTS